MSNEELAGRLVVLEVMAMSTLGLYLANAKNDPDMSKARALLGFIKSTVEGRVVESSLSPDAVAHARHFADDLLSQALENLELLRGGKRR